MPNKTYKITVQPSGHEFRAETNETILEAALNQGCMLPYSCRGGTCGSCIGKVLTGDFTYTGQTPPGISELEQRQGKALLCQALARTDLVIEAREINAVRDIEVKTLPCRVMDICQLAPDVMRLYLKLPANERLQFLAGQYIDIILRDGRRRSFSLANPPHADEYLELHIRLVPNGEFTGFVFQGMREKAILRFQGPLGYFFLREDSRRPIIMMAGGTGFAPMKSILEHAFQIGVRRPIHLYWGARARQDLYQNELAGTWMEKYSNFRYTPVLSEAPPEDQWQGRSGWVHEAVAADYPNLNAYEVYMSGPPPMIDAAKKVFRNQGLADDHLFYDSFDFAPDSQPGA